MDSLERESKPMTRKSLNDILWHVRRLVAPHAPAGLTDSNLIERFVSQHDQAAFEALLLRHGPMVWGVCRGLSPDLHAAEDAFQATWLVFVRKAGGIRQRHRLANWLYGVAHKVAARARTTALRRQAREQAGVERLAAVSPEDPALRELNQVLQEELNRLPAKYRVPMLLCYLEGRTQEEAADTLGWSRGSVRGRLERGRQRLRLRLERRGVALSAGVLAVFFSESASAAALPPLLARTTTLAGLQFAAKGSSTAGAVAPPAAALAEGVCKMMALAKIKVVIGVLLAAVLLGGAGLLAGRGSGGAGPEEPTKDTQPPPAVQSERERNLTLERAEEDLRRAERDREHLEQEARKLKEDLNESEDHWLMELIDARAEVMELQERLRRLERDQKVEHAHAVTVLQGVRSILQSQKGVAEGHAPGTPLESIAKKRVKDLEIEVAQIETRGKTEEKQQLAQWIKVRSALVKAEEKLKLLERRQTRERQRMEADLDAVHERIRQARTPSVRLDGQERRTDLERKVDRLLREVEELRREVHSQDKKPGL
jgi:RNA polymerase sigma factor (sigma-70 family)